MLWDPSIWGPNSGKDIVTLFLNVQWPKDQKLSRWLVLCIFGALTRAPTKDIPPYGNKKQYRVSRYSGFLIFCSTFSHSFLSSCQFSPGLLSTRFLITVFSYCRGERCSMKHAKKVKLVTMFIFLEHFEFNKPGSNAFITGPGRCRKVGDT